MRLTLRTLLAYRDGVLDPKDAAVLESKINESSTAQQISQRIEQEMRNRRIAPIPVDAREFGFDANMVAEFLDDTISTETLPEMERQCLENSMLLSEIGCCHQILSRALTMPVSISGSLRQRIRDLQSRPASHSGNLNRILEKHGHIRRIDPAAVSHLNASETDLSSALMATESTKPLESPGVELRRTGIELSDGLGRQVPEYLIGSDRSWMKRAALAALLLVSLVVVSAVAIGPLGRVQALLQKTELPTLLPGEKRKQADQQLIKQPDPKVVENAAVIVDSDKIESASVPEKEVANATKPDNLHPEVADAMPADVEPADVEPVSSASSVVDLAKGPAMKDPAIPISNEPLPVSVQKMQWLPITKESATSIVMKRVVDADSGDVAWTRLSPGDSIGKKERIVIPPFQRTEFEIAPGIRWLCTGENQLELASSNDILNPMVPRVLVRSGQTLVFATPDAQKLEVDCNGLVIAIQFNQVDASIGLEVETSLSPIEDELLAQGKFESSSVVRLFSVQGSVEYAAFDSLTPGAPSMNESLSVGQFTTWEKGKATIKQDLTDTPHWFRSSVLRPIDQLAISDMQKALSECPANEMEATLTKLTGRRQAEIVAIASRSRIMLGDYANLFSTDGVFHRKELRIHWQAILEQLEKSLGDEENQIRFMEKLRESVPGRVNSILTLVVPRSQSQLSSGADKLLVESLSSSSMDERILAISQLEKITNKRMGYHPDKNPTDSIPAWRKALSRGEIRYFEPKSVNEAPNE